MLLSSSLTDLESDSEETKEGSNDNLEEEFEESLHQIIFMYLIASGVLAFITIFQVGRSR